MAKDMTLMWGSGSPPCWKAQIALEEKNLQGYNSILLAFDKGEHKSQQVLDINPRGQLPAFKHGDRIVNESYGICSYLESQFKSQGTKLIPECGAEQARMYQRMYEGQTLAQKMMDVLTYHMKVPEEERHESAVKRNREALSAEVKIWEGYLQKGPGPYLAGKDFTMADVTVYPNIAFLFRLGLCEKHYPKLAEYHNFLKNRPSIKATWPPTWRENPKGQDLLKNL